MDEKSAFYAPAASQPQRTTTARLASARRTAVWLFVILAGSLYLALPLAARAWGRVLDKARAPPPLNLDGVCVQPAALFPYSGKDNALDKAYEHLDSAAFRNASIGRLAGAVQIKTETFDDLGEVGEDARWDVFYGFAGYLERTFPQVHSKLKVDKINTHGLLYTWQGSDASLKPSVLMAHQDTVPVPDDTIASWDYPPWSGHYDGSFIWGRGASDCKNQLIAALEATEELLLAGFQPRRTLLLAFGYDEESFGFHGAGNISAVIYERYGQDGLAAVIDEGASFENVWGTLFAKPGTAEKGSTNVQITVRSPGGHSSIPHDHTSIGILAEIITAIESVQYRTHVDETNPFFSQLQCGAAHAADFPATLRRLLPGHTSEDNPDLLAIEAAKQGPEIKYLLQTSQAVDIFHAGVKVNAQPERASAIVNHRVNLGETVDIVYDHLTELVGPIAAKHGLAFHPFDGGDEPDSIILFSNHGSNSSPVSPADGSIVSPYAILAGSVRAVYGEETIVTPGIMTGNTDTRYFWDLTKHIFRFGPGYSPADDKGLLGVHTINEKVNVQSHINGVKFFTLFIRNIDEADLVDN